MYGNNFGSVLSYKNHICIAHLPVTSVHLMRKDGTMKLDSMVLL